MNIENKASITKSINTIEQRTQPKPRVVASATETDPYAEPIKHSKENACRKVPKPPTEEQD